MPELEPDDELVPIDEAARRFGLRASALRYYEERGLLSPAARHAGRRWYSQQGLRRLAVIRYWQECGLMGLSEIGDMLEARPDDGRWRAVVEAQVATLGSRIAAMTAARAFLEHVLEHHDCAPDGCPHYEESVWAHAGSRRVTPRASAPAVRRP